jgi:hypothetical protein
VLLAKWIPEAIEYEIELDHNITSLSAYIYVTHEAEHLFPKPEKDFQHINRIEAKNKNSPAWKSKLRHMENAAT